MCIRDRDMVSVTDKMARSILGNPQIAHAPNAPYIVLQPVENETRFPINKEIFLTKIRIALNTKAQGKVRFLDRSEMASLENERNMKRAGQITSSSDPGLQEFK